jgi:hypothetical protein
MGLLDRLMFWREPGSTRGAGSERVPLNPVQMIFVEKVSQQLGWPSGLTSLTREQHDVIKAQMPMFESLDRYSGVGGDSKVSAYHVAAALASLYTKATETRKELVAEVHQISNFYLVDVIVSQFCEDALNPDVTTDEIFQLVSDKPKIQAELKYLEKTFRLDKLVKEVMPEVLRFGEYTLSTVVKTSEQTRNEAVLERLAEARDKDEFSKAQPGLVQLNDNVDQSEVVAICKNSEVDYYLNMVQRGNQVQLERKHKSAYVQFRLDSERVRVDLQREFNNLTPKQKEEISKLPRFVRMGKSFVHSMIPKIRELELLEKLSPATKLSELSAGTLIGLQVPAGYDLKKGMEAAKTLEGIINRKLAIADDTGRISVESILTSVGRTKVVPVFGDKGSTNVMETRSAAPDNLTADINTLRKVILDGIGVPYELVFSSDGQNKADILKRYSRYLRKLKAVQRTAKEGLVQIASIHLAAKGIPFDPSDIKVNFHNKLIELDNLDKLEFIDGSISLLSNTKEFVEGMLGSPALGQNVNVQEFVVYLKDQLRLLGLEDLVLLKPARPALADGSMSPLGGGEEDDQADGTGPEADDEESPEETEP